MKDKVYLLWKSSHYANAVEASGINLTPSQIAYLRNKGAAIYQDEDSAAKAEQEINFQPGESIDDIAPHADGVTWLHTAIGTGARRIGLVIACN